MASAEIVILAKKEVVYATDVAPTPAANAIITRNFTSSPIEGDTLDRNIDSASNGSVRVAFTNRRQTLAYEVELAGSGAAGTAAPWMELLEACGLAAPVLTAGQKAEQAFAAPGAGVSALTQYHWRSGQRRRGVGSRGTFGLTFTAGAYPFARLNYVALVPFATPVDAVAPGVPQLARWMQPVEINADNTVFTLGGYAAPLKELTIDAAADVKLRSLVGARYVLKGKHKLGFKAVVEAPDLAVKSYWSQLGAEQVLQLVHGTVAGNIVQVDAARAQILKIDESVEDDILMLTITGQLNINVGQDDLLLTAK